MKYRIVNVRLLFIRTCMIGFLLFPGVVVPGAAQTVKIVCVGNSITEGSTLASPATRAYPALLQKKLGSGYVIGNHGVSGRTMLKKGDCPYWAEAKFAEIFAVKPDIITIMLGTNDSKPHNWIHGAEYETDYAAMIDTFSTIPTHPKVLLCLPPACFANTLKISDSVLGGSIVPKIEALAKKRALPVIDSRIPTLFKKQFFGDGVHPDTSGHAMLADIFYEGIANNAINQMPRWRYLWYGGAPGPGALNGKDSTDKPRVDVFVAPDSLHNGAAVVICPGGAYDHLATDKEGHKVAAWFNSYGVTAFVLRYRFSPYRHPVPLDDAGRAMRLVRYYAARYGIDSARIGICGFSAGGHLASTLGTHFDGGNGTDPDLIGRKKSRPDFMVLVYPVITLKGPFAHVASRTNLLGSSPGASLVDSLCNQSWVTSRTPQTFICHGDSDKSVPKQNSLMFDSACAANAVPERLFIDPGKGHGYGLAGAWPQACLAWLRERNIIPGTTGIGVLPVAHPKRQMSIRVSGLVNGAFRLAIHAPSAHRIAVYSLSGKQLAVFKSGGAASHTWRPPSAGVYCVHGTIDGSIVTSLITAR